MNRAADHRPKRPVVRTGCPRYGVARDASWKEGDEVNDELLIAIDEAKAIAVEPVSLSDLALQERAHLQEWVLAHPSVIAPE